MRVLLELDRRGTLGAVAQATGYSKSAVSQQLAALQRAVGVPLAERVGRRLRLTPAGMALLPSASQILASVEAVRGTLDPEAEPVGEVRVAAFASLLTGPVLRAIRELSARHPRLAILLQEREPREVDTLLTNDEVDVGFVHDYSLVPRYHPDQAAVRLLTERPMALIIPSSRHDGRDEEPARILGGEQAEWITNSRGSDDDELPASATSTSTGRQAPGGSMPAPGPAARPGGTTPSSSPPRLPPSRRSRCAGQSYDPCRHNDNPAPAAAASCACTAPAAARAMSWRQATTPGWRRPSRTSWSASPVQPRGSLRLRRHAGDGAIPR